MGLPSPENPIDIAKLPLPRNITQPESQARLWLSLVLFFGVLVFFAVPLSKVPFSSHGEAREAVVVQNMVQQGSYILPLRNGADIPSKPPGFHWLALATSIATGNVDEFSTRFPSALASAIAVSLSFYVVSIWIGFEGALLLVLLLCTSFEWMRSASLARVDMVFTLFTGVAMLFAYRISCGIGSSAASALGLILALSAGVLTKGPAGLGIPLIVGGAMTVLADGAPLRSIGAHRIRRLLLLCVAGAVAAAICTVWYYRAYLIGGEEFLRVQIMRENVARLLGTESYEAETGHHAPFYYGILLLFAGMLPWSLLLPPCAIVLWKKRASLRLAENRPILFSLLWCAVFLAIVTISGSKRTVYFLPAFPPALFLILWALPALQGNRWGRELVRLFSLLICAIPCVAILMFSAERFGGVSVGELLPLSERGRHDFNIVWKLLTSSPLSLATAALAAALGAAAFMAARRRLAASFTFIALLLLVVVFQTNTTIYPALAAEKSPREFMAEVNRLVPAAAPLFQFRDNFYSAMFYARRNLSFTGKMDEVRALPLAFVIAENKYVGQALTLLSGGQIVLQSTERISEGKDGLTLLIYQHENQL